MVVLVSACLLGENCKYNGKNNYSQKVKNFLEGHMVIPVCPEVLGGLSIPRPPAEIVDGVVKTEKGISVDKEFRLGAEKALAMAIDKGADVAILQSRSPSCGVKEIYDGTFSGKKIAGMGVFAKLLKDNNIKVIDVEDL